MRRIIKHFNVSICVGIALMTFSLHATDADHKAFKDNLSQMLQRIEKSTKILRVQISENPNAPFLADLYLQLGEMLWEKSNTLYYIQMEKENLSDVPMSTFKNSKGFSPVREAMLEAIQIFKTLLKDFPSSDKRKKTLYLLTIAQEAVGETNDFIKMVSLLTKDYPNSIEAAQARLLHAQYYYTRHDYKKTIETLQPILNSSFVYEKNLARYRSGLSYQNLEKFPNALQFFEQVATDTQLKEDDSPTVVSFKSKGAQSNLKREALIDSIKAYTSVHVKNAQPIEYYSKICPNETLFQEVMEKLALRYVNMKKYEVAVNLLRRVSERMTDPQKIINIYQEVLLLIPLQERVQLPPDEIRFVLDKYNLWISYFKIPPDSAKQSFSFFEKQVRDLGTRSHELGKSIVEKPVRKTKANKKKLLEMAKNKEREKQKKQYFLTQAEQYYLIYLSSFERSENAAKIAMNLADVYFATERYLQSADFYLRVYSGEFGVVTQRELLLQNALLCTEKKAEYSFYEQLRNRGLRIKTLEQYIALSPQKRKDPQVQFALVKAKYEQGFYDATIPKLYAYMKIFSNTPYAADAGELVLDYYNTRNDFDSLAQAADKISKLGLKDKKFVAKVEKIKAQADKKKLQEYVKMAPEYDAFEQGKNYLKIAQQTTDRGLASLALKTALNRSRSEQDIDTFLKTAAVLQEKEPKAEEKVKIQQSIIDENIRVTRYHEAQSLLKKIMDDSSKTAQVRVSAMEEGLQLAVVLKDWETLSEWIQNPLWEKIPQASQSRVFQQVSDAINSPIEIPEILVEKILQRGMNANTLLALYKSTARINSRAKSKVAELVDNVCRGKQSTFPVCKWETLKRLEKAKADYASGLQNADPSPQSIEKQANKFTALTNAYQQLEKSGDPQLDMLLSLENKFAYEAFANFLLKVGRKNPALKAVLTQKASESIANAKQYQARCRQIATRSATLTPVNPYCLTNELPPVEELVGWQNTHSSSKKISDLTSSDAIDLQKRVFGMKEPDEAMLKLAQLYFDKGYFNHAAATAQYGINSYPNKKNDFKSILGCSLSSLGLFNEANFHLLQAKQYGEFKGLAEKCYREVASFK